MSLRRDCIKIPLAIRAASRETAIPQSDKEHFADGARFDRIDTCKMGNR